MMSPFSLLDTDLYKFTTSYAYMKLFPDAECTFTFADRNRVKRSEEFLNNFKRNLKELEKYNLREEEKVWCIDNIPFIPSYYWEWLSSFRFDPDKINVLLDEDGVLNMEVTDKIWKASLYEIPCLYLVPETTNDEKEVNLDLTLEMLDVKINLANMEGLMFSEFGTRRRFNFEVQDEVVKRLKEKSKTCVGTSNVYLAMKYGMKTIGTHPHEWFMFHGAQFGYKSANYMALENWVKVYDGNLGIALSDTYTTDVFFRNFSLKQAKLFDGVRQDSGDEREFIEKAVKFYEARGIDPKTKTIIFSNALDFPKAVQIKEDCEGKIKASFGIGTNLTCDVYDPSGNKYKSENIVMKMSKCRMNSNQPWYPCIKISDDLGKHMGKNEEFKNACRELGIKI